MGFLSTTPVRTRKTKPAIIPTVDLSTERSNLIQQLVKASEEYGFFKIVNHGIPKEIITRLEKESTEFFARPSSEKERAGNASPFGYGSKNIGPNGDMGELEYLLLHCNSLTNSEKSKPISTAGNTIFRQFLGDLDDEMKRAVCRFCSRCSVGSIVNDYMEAIREIVCGILELVAEGLWLPDKNIFSRLIRDIDSDSVLRINHYPPVKNIHCVSSSKHHHCRRLHHIGFGEHSDPQILTILRSNDVGGLQIFTHDGDWLPVPPDPDEFFVMVGDAFQVLTNGRFRSVRHRALTNSAKARISMMYFGAPPLESWIAPVADRVTPQSPNLYKPFTWAEYKQAMYSLRLGDSRLDLFKTHPYPR